MTWSVPTDVSAAGASVGYPGATPGPAAGVQVKDGTLAFCNWGNRYNGTTFGKGGWARWGEATNFGNFLTLSSDLGETVSHSDMLLP